MKKWIYDAFEDNEEIVLNSLGVHFLLADVYTDVELGLRPLGGSLVGTRFYRVRDSSILAPG